MIYRAYVGRSEELGLDRLGVTGKPQKGGKSVHYKKTYPDLPDTEIGISVSTMPLVAPRYRLVPFDTAITIKARRQDSAEKALERLRMDVAAENGKPNIEPAGEEIQYIHQGEVREANYKKSLGNEPSIN